MDSSSEPMEGSDLDGSFSDFEDDDNAYFSSGDEEKEDEENRMMEGEGKFGKQSSAFFYFLFFIISSLNFVPSSTTQNSQVLELQKKHDLDFRTSFDVLMIWFFGWKK